LNVPSISWWQWHPFSICSSNNNKQISFLIKNSGDFTSKLIKLFANKLPSISSTIYNITSKEFIADKFIKELDSKSNHKDEIEYPLINLSYPISSPAVSSKKRKHVIYIGTGAGIATFLSFVDNEYINSLNEANSNTSSDSNKSNRRVDIVFVSRDLQHMRWIARYIDGVLRFPSLTEFMRFHIYITVKPESNNLASFLFWRALTLLNYKRENSLGKENTLMLKLGRPNFSKLLDEIINRSEAKKHWVYACGPKIMTDTLGKL